MTGVTRKEYRVWMAVLDHPGSWLDMQSLGKYADMTARQASTVVAHMSDPRLVREDAMVRFDGDAEEARLARREVEMMCFDITEEDLDRVRSAMSDVGGVTISDISNETGYCKQDVARMLRMMDDVCPVPAKAQTLYYKERRGGAGPLLNGFQPFLTLTVAGADMVTASAGAASAACSFAAAVALAAVAACATAASEDPLPEEGPLILSLSRTRSTRSLRKGPAYLPLMMPTMRATK